MVTPSFSKDLSTLLSLSYPRESIAYSLHEARESLTQTDISKCSLLRNRVKLQSNEDWDTFLMPDSELDRSGKLSIDLVSVLKKCYKIAFSMPNSPSVAERTPKKIGCEGSTSPPSLMI